MGSFPRVSGLPHLYAHNIFLETVGEFGLVGVYFSVVLVTRLLVGLVKLEIATWPILCSIFCFVLMQSSGSIFDARFVAVFLIFGYVGAERVAPLSAIGGRERLRRRLPSVEEHRGLQVLVD